MMYYQCECGSTQFNLRKDGKVECAGCDCEYMDIAVHLPEGIPDEGAIPSATTNSSGQGQFHGNAEQPNL